MTTSTASFTSEQENLWNAFTETLATLNLHLDRCLKKEAKIKLSDYRILATLMDANSISPTAGPLLRMRDLAQITSVSASRLTYQIEALERHGWVAKVPVLHDKRGKGIVITPLGQQAYRQASPVYAREVQRTVFTGLDSSTAVAVSLLSRAIQNNITSQSKTQKSR